MATIPIEPRCVSAQHQQDEHVRETTTMTPKPALTVSLPHNPIKTVFSWDNEYLFIGIIIILITVILMLIVYIVKNRAVSTPVSNTQTSEQPPPQPTDPDKLKALANNPFVPQSQREQQQQSPPDETPIETSSQPQQWDSVAAKPEEEPIADSQPVVEQTPVPKVEEPEEQQVEPPVAPQLAKRRRGKQ